MSVPPIDYSVEDSVATLVFNIPMLNRRTMPQLMAALERAEADPAVGAVVLTGRHHVFLSGADLAEVATLKGRSEVMDFLDVPIRIIQLLRSSKCISFAAINGFCLGGGFEIAIACDFRYCAETLPASIAKSAFIGLPEVTLGLVPGAGGAFLAGRAAGYAHLTDLMMTGRSLDPQEACRMGLVHASYPRPDLLRAVQSLARRVLSETCTGMATVRKVINGPRFFEDLEDAQKGEAEAFAESLFQPATQRKIAQFLQSTRGKLTSVS